MCKSSSTVWRSQMMKTWKVGWGLKAMREIKAKTKVVRRSTK